MHIPTWLNYLMIITSIACLTISIFTIMFQIKNPKSRQQLIICEQFIGEIWEDSFYQSQDYKQSINQRCSFKKSFFQISVSRIMRQGMEQSPDHQSLNYALFLVVQKLQLISSLNFMLYGQLCQSNKSLKIQYIKSTDTFFSIMHQHSSFLYPQLGSYLLVMNSVLKQIAYSFILTNFQESIQCGIMHTPGLDDEILMLLPFMLVPIEIFLITKIMKETPFIVKETTYVLGDKVTFLCLTISTLCEPVFEAAVKKKWLQLTRQRPVKKYKKPKIKTNRGQNQDSLISFGEMSISPPSVNSLSVSSEDDFEIGDNQLEMKDDLDVEDESQFQRLVNDGDQQFTRTTRMTMSLEQKTNFFIINTVLMSVTQCFLFNKRGRENVVGMVGGIIKFAKKALTYQLSFSPRENVAEMTQFQEGSGKSASLFFFTANKQFVIKTLKQAELDLLAKKGVLEKYYSYLQKHPKSLLARFYGIYTIKIQHMRKINVIIMDNLMGKYIEDATRIYDLKGSTFQRIVQEPKSELQTRKDLNFQDDRQFRMQVNKNMQKDILSRIHKDKEFLKSCELMDYSLLLVFFRKGRMLQQAQSPQNLQGQNPFDIATGDQTYRNRKMSIFIKHGDEGKYLCVEEDKFFDHDSPINKSKSFLNAPSMNLGLGRLNSDQDIRPIEKSNSLAFDEYVNNNVDTNHNKNFTLGINQSSQPTIQRSHNSDQLKPRTDEYIQYDCENDENIYYRIGIIDFLQKYNRAKKMENKWLRFRNRNVAPDTFSCVDPKLYGDRFLNFMKTNLFGRSVRDSEFMPRQTFNIQLSNLLTRDKTQARKN
ncbi:UNKNOWN [Stylonychia lemnae]|uniref:PIPK domain-containing protein n=1 Tax=Stylonychia lemnae TaxID=5949 RepID=A0A078B6A8_STYLE|nr:UNKNOWN [Stylonychia lemnae]|eukprot:CDW90060.1 UNKNOWN [Stylonychia lemnae]